MESVLLTDSSEVALFSKVALTASHQCNASSTATAVVTTTEGRRCGVMRADDKNVDTLSPVRDASLHISTVLVVVRLFFCSRPQCRQESPDMQAKSKTALSKRATLSNGVKKRVPAQMSWQFAFSLHRVFGAVLPLARMRCRKKREPEILHRLQACSRVGHETSGLATSRK